MARIARRGQKSQQADVALIYADLIAIADAARELGISQRSLRRWIADGRVQVIPFGEPVRMGRLRATTPEEEEGICGMRRRSVRLRSHSCESPSIDPCNLTRTSIHDNSLLSSPVITRQFVSSSQASRTGPADRSPSLEDVVLNLRNNSALSPQRRQNMVSACNAVARDPRPRTD